MAEFNREPLNLAPEQIAVVRRVLNTHIVYNEGRYTKDGMFEMIDKWATRTSRPIRPEGFEPILMFSRFLREFNPGLHSLRVSPQARRLQIVRSQDQDATPLLADKLRIVDPVYTDIFDIGESGWVKINVRNDQGQPIMSDEIYEELVVRGLSVQLSPNSAFEPFWKGALAIEVPQAYAGFKGVQVIAFHPLVETVRGGFITPLDAVLFDKEGYLIPKRVVKTTSRIRVQLS
ncbi:hypothetical protein HYS92_01545 [Candidatus Daviesbacteria bacterium]|nr:hypothetical protein [Candidatus Daviesbacteria bacterium]